MKWQQLGIEEICKEIFAGGDAPPKNQRSNEKTEEFSIPIFSNGVEDAGLYGYTNYSRTEEQAITVSARGTIGHIEIRNEPYLPIVRLISLIPDPNKVDIIFLKYSLLASEIFSTGSSIPQLTVPMIKKLVIPLPPLPVQKQIVEKLDAAFADIDKAISATQKNIENAEALFQSSISEIFRDIEKQENIRALSEVCKIVNGGTPKSKIKDYWDGDIPWITPKDMGKINTKFVKDTERKITKLGLDKSSAKLVDENSVILSSRAPIGYLNINEVKMAFNQGCKGLVPGEKLDNNYLYYFLMKSKKLLNDLGSGTTFKELSGTKLKSVNISVVDLEIQKLLANKCDQLIFHINETKAIKKKKLSQLNSLKSSILNQAFSGELTKDAA